MNLSFATAADSEGASILQYHKPEKMLLGGPSPIIAAVSFIFSQWKTAEKCCREGPGLIIASVNFAFTTRVRNTTTNNTTGLAITTPQHAMEVNSEQSQTNASRNIPVTLSRYAVCDCPALRSHADIALHDVTTKNHSKCIETIRVHVELFWLKISELSSSEVSCKSCSALSFEMACLAGLQKLLGLKSGSRPKSVKHTGSSTRSTPPPGSSCLDGFGRVVKYLGRDSVIMAPRWHQGTMTPRVLKKK